MRRSLPLTAGTEGLCVACRDECCLRDVWAQVARAVVDCPVQHGLAGNAGQEEIEEPREFKGGGGVFLTYYYTTN